MSCPSQKFALTQEPYDALAAKGRAAGLTITGEAGQSMQHGCAIGWTYDSAAGVLTITPLSKPFYVPCDAINQKIRELIEG